MRSNLIALIFAGGIVAAGLAGFASHTRGQGPAPPVFSPSIPKTWDDAAMATLEVPLAGLNVRPAAISEEEYYSLRADRPGLPGSHPWTCRGPDRSEGWPCQGLARS